AVLLAFGMLFPEERMFIIPIPVPIKAKWIIVGSVAMELFSAFGTSNDGVAHLAHLGGMLFGFILIKYWKKHPYGGYNNFGMNSGSDFFDKMKHN
ncbi:rhomboid family intramembrane serine protease, partial [Veillonella nakazawae]|nr:rhomboid family intramembrane serine protease [Veillonella nakazawae]